MRHWTMHPLAALLVVVAGAMAAPAFAAEQALATLANRPIGDCDDTSASVHPGAVEVENGIDDDCDGLADEAPDGTPSSSISDDDGDGWTIAQGDCNDHNAAAHPGAVESTGDRIDNDCDGLADEGVDGTPSADSTDQDADGLPMSNDRVFGDAFESA